jgi:hypothetical protein
LPLCADHRLTRCHRCEELFPLNVTKRKSIGERADTNLRHGMSPRMEKVYGSFCPDCYETVRASSRAKSSGSAPNYALFAVLLVVFLVALAGVGALIIATR